MQWCKEFMSIRGLSDYIKVYDDVISKETCDHLIQTFESVDLNDKRDWHNETYKFSEASLFKEPAFKQYVSPFSTLMGQVHNFYADQFEFFPNRVEFEQPRIKKYEPLTDHFNWHCDAVTPESINRVLVMFFYLNDVEEGGETLFKDMSVKPKAGSVVCFPPTWQYPHKGCTPISGPKYVISSYVQI